MKFYLYCRKSSEDSDRQIQSIDDQKKVMLEMAQKQGLEIVQIFQESQSAKKPGRKFFGKMMDGIKKGKAEGILTWKLDRLARNPIDGGEISWMLQQGIIQKIITNDRNYYPTDNVLMMSVELGMANQFILDLSKNIRRGNKSKCEKGGWCGVAPLGYDNDRINRTVIPDTERFHLVRKMWDLMLTGNYTVAKIAKMVREDWKFKTIQRRKSGGVSPSNSRIYIMFKNPFYYGQFKRNGEWFIGNHEPMITKDEFDRVQKLISKNRRERPQEKVFPFTGMMKCGECGCGITAEDKSKKLSNGTTKIYTYYHCTKKKTLQNPKIKCVQKSIEKKELERQIEEKLSQIEISEKFLRWIQKYLLDQTKSETTVREKQIKTLEKELKKAGQRLDNLIKLKISPENSDGMLLTDEEFKNQKNEIIQEKNEIQTKLKNTDEKQNEWIDLADQTFRFARIAKEKFKNGTLEDKKLILQCIGSHIDIKDQTVNIELRKVFQIIQKTPKVRTNKKPLPQKGNGSLVNKNSVWYTR